MISPEMLLILSVVIISVESSLSFTSDAVIAGKLQHEMILKESQMPSFGSCWVSALDMLHHGCKHLDDDVQARLALAFANCFLLKSGLVDYPCDKDVPIASCIKNMDERAFSVYTSFFTHTHNMCQFLESQIWHQNTADLMNGLASESFHLMSQLKLANEKQNQLMSQLEQDIRANRQSLMKSFQDFKSAAAEQQLLVSAIFDRVSSLQSLVLGEFTWLQSLVWYLVALCVSFPLTAVKRTRAARLPVFLLLVFFVMLENSLSSLALNWEFEFMPEEAEATVHWRVWLCRKLWIGIAMLCIVYHALVYKDLKVESCRLMQDLKQQQTEIRAFIVHSVGAQSRWTAVNGHGLGTRSADVMDCGYSVSKLPKIDEEKELNSGGEKCVYVEDEECDSDDSFTSAVSYFVKDIAKAFTPIKSSPRLQSPYNLRSRGSSGSVNRKPEARVSRIQRPRRLSITSTPGTPHKQRGS